MQLIHEGWSQERGCFCHKYGIDTNRTDHEIHWKDGRVCKQLTPFEIVERDWNNDGDIYEEFGAMFEGKYGREWWTPYHLLSLMIDGEADVPGIKEVK